MARIETYAVDTNLQNSDKWIGTDETGNVTKNYTLEAVTTHIVDIATGNIIVNAPDEEDITAIAQKLKFKDRDATGNQKGYKIIRADFDWLNIPAGHADSIWEIRYDFTLGNAAITLPDNVCMHFNGGFITNYTSITAVNGKSDVSESVGFDESGTISATWVFSEVFTAEDKIKLDAERFDATIGATGAEYTTFKAAVDAGETSIRAIANTTEVSDTTMPSSLVLYIDQGITCNFSAFNITASANVEFKKEGEGNIAYASGTLNKEFFDEDVTTSTFIFENGVFDNNSTFSGCVLSNAASQTITNCTVDIANIDACGVKFLTQDSFLSNVKFIGGGTSCYEVLDMDDGTALNITLNGDFSGLSGNNAIRKDTANAIIKNVFIDTTSSTPRLLHNSGTIRDFFVKSPDKASVLVNGSGSVLENFTLNGGDLDIGDRSSLIIRDVKDVKLISVGGANRNNIFDGVVFEPTTPTIPEGGSKFINCRMDSAGSLTFSGDNAIINSLTLSNGNITITGDNITLVACEANIITIDAAASDTILMGNRTTLGSIVDNGTNTIEIATGLK